MKKHSSLFLPSWNWITQGELGSTDTGSSTIKEWTEVSRVCVKRERDLSCVPNTGFIEMNPNHLGEIKGI